MVSTTIVASLGGHRLYRRSFFHQVTRPLGATINWKAASSGTFSVGINWTGNAAPGVNDSAQFTVSAVGNNYTVTFNSSPTNQAVTVNTPATVTFQSSGRAQTYSLTTSSGVSVNNGILDLGTGGNPLNLASAGWLTAQTGGDLNVACGSHLTANAGLWLGEVGGGVGYVTVDGAGSWLTAPGGAYLGGNGGVGSLTFQNSATGSIAGAIFMANDTNPSSTGHLTVQSGDAVDRHQPLCRYRWSEWASRLCHRQRRWLQHHANRRRRSSRSGPARLQRVGSL